jgi:glycosyltransferase involved in cell wall biosynthesis
MIRIAVLTSHHGDFKDLRRCILSVKRESELIDNNSFEICHYIAIDGALCQSDYNPDLLLTGQDSYSFFLEYGTSNLGKSTRMNQLIASTDSDIVMFLDSDDIFLSGKIARHCEFLLANRESLVGSSYYTFSGQNIFHGPIIPFLHPDQIASHFIFYPHMLFSTMSIFRNKLESIDGSTLFDQTLRAGLDYEFYSRLISVVKFTNIPEPLVAYKISKNGITRTSHTRTLQLRVHLKVARSLLSTSCLLHKLTDLELALCLFGNNVDPELQSLVAIDNHNLAFHCNVLHSRIRAYPLKSVVALPILDDMYNISYDQIISQIFQNLSSRF